MTRSCFNNKSYRFFGSIIIVVFSIFVLNACSSSGADTDEVAEKLEDRLTEALKFIGGEVVQGSPPQASSEAQAPDILSIVMSDMFVMDSDFAIELNSSYDGSSPVDKVVVHVIGANNHIVISSELANQFVRLTGTCISDEEFSDKSFTLNIAMQNAAGLTGEYISNSLTISSKGAIDTREVLANIDIENSTVIWIANWNANPSPVQASVKSVGCTTTDAAAQSTVDPAPMEI